MHRKGRKEKQNKTRRNNNKNNEMGNLCANIPIITLCINSLNTINDKRFSLLDITILIINVYATNRTSKYVKQKLIELQGETEKSTITVGTSTVST